MISLAVCRPNGSELQADAPLVFYDEKLEIRIQSQELCAVHLHVAVTGIGAAKTRVQNMVIIDENLAPNVEWTRTLHVRHPRSALQTPQLNIVATARSDEEVIGIEESTERKYVRPFQSVSDERSNLLLFSESTSSRGHARMLSTSSGIDFAEAYAESGLDNEDPYQQSTTESGAEIGLGSGLKPQISQISQVSQISQASQASQVSQVSQVSQESHKISDNEDHKAHVVRWHAMLAQALELEVRTVRPALERDRVIAEIDLVSGNFDVVVNTLEVKFEYGIATMMGTLETPIKLKKHENYALCFNLQLRVAPQANFFASRKPLNIYLRSEVVDPVGPQITTLWTPVINFENSQGPFPKTPALTIPLNSPVVPSAQTMNQGSQSGFNNSNAGTNSNLNSSSNSNMNMNSNLNSGPGSGSGSSSNSNSNSNINNNFNPNSSTNLSASHRRTEFEEPGPNMQSTALELVKPQRQQNLTLMGGLSIVVTGPQFVQVGDVFEWEFTIINKSQRSRVFTITFGTGTEYTAGFNTPNAANSALTGGVINDIAGSQKYVGAKPGASSSKPMFISAPGLAPGPGPIDTITSARQRSTEYNSNAMGITYNGFAYNPSLLRKMAKKHYKQIGSNCGLIPLCQELRVGTLAPHVCFQTRIQLLALKKGTHSIENSRIEDLTNRDTYDVGGMLDVIVQ